MTTRYAVLQVGAFPFPSHQGSQVYVSGMCRALAKRGHDVTLATYGHGEGDEPPGVRRLRAPVLPGSRFSRSGPHLSKVPLDGLLAATISAFLRRHPVDVIHAHNVEAPLVGVLAKLLAGQRIPLVYNLHTSLEEELPAYWKAGLAGRLATPLGRSVDQLLPRISAGCIALSQRSAVRLREQGAVNVHHVPPGVDLDELTGGDADRARRRWSLGEGPWVVYAGNADPYQDLDVLFEAMTRLPRAGLLIVSGSPLSPWQALADRLGIGPERLRLVQSASFADAKDALAAGRVAALPRATCAGFPIKLLNQLGMGRVTVAAEDSARPIEGVFSVPGRDPVALAGCLGAILEDPEMADRLGEAARRAVSARWTWDAQARRLKEVYATVVGGAR